jgi:NADPH2:quinone reductase
LILTKKDNLKESLTKLKGIKFDIIYDTIGGSYTNDSLSFIDWEGKLLIMGFASGDIASIPTNKILLKGCDIIGIFWGPFARGNKNFNLECLNEVSSLFNQGLIKLSKPTMFHISDFLKAMKGIKDRRSVGKLCLYTDSFKRR